MTSTVTDVPQLIRAARSKKKLTQQQLADALHVSQSLITRAETGSHLALPLARKLARFLEIDLDLLTEWVTEKRVDGVRRNVYEDFLESEELPDHSGDVTTAETLVRKAAALDAICDALRTVCGNDPQRLIELVFGRPEAPLLTADAPNEGISAKRVTVLAEEPPADEQDLKHQTWLQIFQNHWMWEAQYKSALVGLHEMVAKLVNLLTSQNTRLVTVTGPAGAGKTRVAEEAAWKALETFRGKIVWIDLSGVTDPDFLPDALASSLGATQNANPTEISPSRSPYQILEQVATLISDTPHLFLLDNFEQLIPAGGGTWVRKLLDLSRSLTCLITSREPLGVKGEVVLAVPPLSLPVAGGPLADIARHASIQLYLDRAQKTDGGFAFTDDNAADVAAICRRLDGRPLAIKIAASLVDSLTPAELLEQIERTLSNDSHEPGREGDGGDKTLRALVWTCYHTLSEAQRKCFAALSVFQGGWTLEAAERVCTDSGGTRSDLPALAGVLISRSLALPSEQAEGNRYRFFEAVRQYGLNKLIKGGEEAQVRDRHRDWCLALAEAPAKVATEESVKFDRLEQELDNLRAAIAWCLETSDAERVLQFANALWRFWAARGHLREGREVFERGLNSESALLIPFEDRVKALQRAGNMADYQGDFEVARGYFRRALEMSRVANDPRREANALNGLGNVENKNGNYSEAERLHRHALSIREGLFNEAGTHEQREQVEAGIADSLNNLANVLSDRGDLKGAMPLLEQSLEIEERLGRPEGIGITVNNLATLLMATGEYDLAKSRYLQGLTIFHDLGHRSDEAVILGNLGQIEISANRKEAHKYLSECLRLCRDLGADLTEQATPFFALERFAILAVKESQWERSAVLQGATDALWTSSSSARPPAVREEHDAAATSTQNSLGGSKYSLAWNLGHRMTLDEVISYTLGEAPISDARDSDTRQPLSEGSLSTV